MFIYMHLKYSQKFLFFKKISIVKLWCTFEYLAFFQYFNLTYDRCHNMDL